MGATQSTGDFNKIPDIALTEEEILGSRSYHSEMNNDLSLDNIQIASIKDNNRSKYKKRTQRLKNKHIKKPKKLCKGLTKSQRNCSNRLTNKDIQGYCPDHIDQYVNPTRELVKDIIKKINTSPLSMEEVLYQEISKLTPNY